MNLTDIKQQLIKEIQASNDEALMAELLGMVKHHQAPSVLSVEQKRILQERINRVEEGKATYITAKELREQINKDLNEFQD